MKRQKRDKLSRARSKGYQAGITGRSNEHCPFHSINIKSQWLGGWREAIGDRSIGLVSR
jgi:ribosome modulation factor